MWTLDQDTYKITMTKGDTPSFKISCNIENAETGELEEYIPEDGDEFIFAAKESKEDNLPVFTIKIPNDTMTVSFQEEHTKKLSLGKYIWEISLNKANGYHCTFICNKVLLLTVEVY